MSQTEIPARLKNIDGLRFILVATKDKRPLEDDWQNTKNYLATDERLLTHLRSGGNYGVLCGSADIVVVDADTDEICLLVDEGLPLTYTVRTGGGGCHYYFKITDGDKKTRPLQDATNPKENLGHIRGVGAQVVGPSSIHPSGNPYTVESDREVASVKMEQLHQALGEFIKFDDERSKNLEDGQAQQLDMNLKDLDILKIIDVSKFTITGDAYQGPHPVHGSTTGKNFSVSQTKGVWHCYRCGSGGGVLSLIAVMKGIIRCDESVPGGLRGDKFKDAVKTAIKEHGLKPVKRPGRPRKDADPFEEESAMAEEIMKRYTFKTAMDNEELHYYSNGIYVATGAEQLVKRLVVELDKDKGSHYADEVVWHIKVRTYTDRKEFNRNPRRIPLRNGIFDMDKMTVESFNPEEIYTMRLPIIFDQTKDAPAIKKFVKEVVKPNEVELVQELFGYTLLRENPLQKAFMFIGDGANGKSTLMDVIRCFLGDENVASVPLVDLDNNRFASSRLYDKLANIYADLPDKSLISTGKFKMLVGEDAVDAERKFKDGFKFINYAKLIFSCNKLPATKDDSTAFYRRWVLVNFPNAFLGGSADKNLKKKLTTEDEIAGLFNWAIEGLKRVLTTGEFTYKFGAEAVRELYDRMSNPLKAFAMDCVDPDSDGWISKEDFYGKFVAYCRDRNLPAPSKLVVGRDITHILPTCREEKRTVGMMRKTGWSGIQYHHPKKEGEEDKEEKKPETKKTSLEGFGQG
ncbi:Uncharacterised protein [uncultured archaeon]|nr:Uncharacterised protein [uncultured archaeon]